MSGLFGHPRGLAGRLVGHLMAVKNQPMNRLAVELLDVWPADVILEIGFGPGQAIKMLARETPASISGIDRSAVMVRQAARRNRAWIAAGRVELRQASAGAIPFAAKRFSKVFAVNSFHHWEDQAAGLAEVRRVLRPGGMVLFCLRMELTRPRFGAAPGLTNDEVAQAKRLLSAAGFSNIEQVDRDLGRRVVCLRGR
jgi:ubiquinone/menaquinone biosynthesis C-methylase UbiE